MTLLKYGSKKISADKGGKKELSVKQKIIFILTFGLILTIVAGLRQDGESTDIKSITRPEAGSVKEVELRAYEENIEEPVKINIKVNPRGYTGQEARDILEDVRERLPELILGENKDTQHITQKLKLDTSLTKYGVYAQWTTSDFETVAYDGEVYNEEFAADEKKNVRLSALLNLSDETLEAVVDVTVLSPVLSENKQREKDITGAIKNAQLESEYEREVHLPEYVNGKNIKYEVEKSSISPWFFIPISAVAAICIWYSDRRKKEKKEADIRDELAADYAGLTSRFSLLCGAGMTVFGAWEKIVADYDSERKDRKKRRAYENMRETLGLINNGMSEPDAYTRFGDDCGIREYKKLGAYLSEYVRKGTGDLKRLLRQEAEESFNRRKTSVKVKAEEAGTRLLFPMIIMLGVVMAIVMLPAMRSFSI